MCLGYKDCYWDPSAYWGTIWISRWRHVSKHYIITLDVWRCWPPIGGVLFTCSGETFHRPYFAGGQPRHNEDGKVGEGLCIGEVHEVGYGSPWTSEKVFWSPGRPAVHPWPSLALRTTAGCEQTELPVCVHDIWSHLEDFLWPMEAHGGDCEPPQATECLLDLTGNQGMNWNSLKAQGRQ